MICLHQTSSKTICSLKTCVLYFVFVIGLGFIEGHSLRESTEEIKEKAVTVYMVMFVFNPFHVTGLFQYSRETAESLWPFDISWGV